MAANLIYSHLMPQPACAPSPQWQLDTMDFPYHVWFTGSRLRALTAVVAAPPLPKDRMGLPDRNWYQWFVYVVELESNTLPAGSIVVQPHDHLLHGLLAHCGDILLAANASTLTPRAIACTPRPKAARFPERIAANKDLLTAAIAPHAKTFTKSHDGICI
jgi:hypothetical protein